MKTEYNVLIVFPTIIKGGAEKLVISIFNHIAEKDVNKIFLLSLNGVFDLNENLSDKIIKIKAAFHPQQNTLINLIQNLIVIPMSIKRIIQRFNINCVISGYEYDSEQHLLAIPIVLFPKKIKLISLIQTDLSPKALDVSWKRRLTYKFVDALRELVFDIIILSTKSILKDISIRKSGKYFIVQNMIDKEAINEKLHKEISPKLLQKLEEKPFFLSVSRYSKQKNLMLLFKAFNLIKDSCLYNLIILGHRSSEKEFERLCTYVSENNLSDRIILLEAVENPYPIIKKAQAVVSTSKYESYPLALLEAMYLQVPIISTKYSCYSDLLSDDNSFLCPDFEPESVANLLCEFASAQLDSKAKIGNAYKFISSHDIKQAVSIYDKILGSLHE